jgi:hypothetical protein
MKMTDEEEKKLELLTIEWSHANHILEAFNWQNMPIDKIDYKVWRLKYYKARIDHGIAESKLLEFKQELVGKYNL